MTITPATGRTTDPLPVIRVERESTQLVVIDVEVAGVDVTGVQTQLTDYSPDGSNVRPGSGWVAATPAGAVVGHLVSPMPPGLHTIWAKYPSSPEIPVRRVAHVRIT